MKQPIGFKDGTGMAKSMAIGKGPIGALDAFNEDSCQKMINKQNRIESPIMMYLHIQYCQVSTQDLGVEISIIFSGWYEQLSAADKSITFEATMKFEH